jgi:hypothetical protein
VARNLLLTPEPVAPRIASARPIRAPLPQQDYYAHRRLSLQHRHRHHMHRNLSANLRLPRTIRILTIWITIVQTEDQPRRDNARGGTSAARSIQPKGRWVAPGNLLYRKPNWCAKGLVNISFRTIVKKWKQELGAVRPAHHVRGFRSRAVLRWLNNPVPQQAERNFLIKLAVKLCPRPVQAKCSWVPSDAVSYQRMRQRKWCGQFKLERWMDRRLQQLWIPIIQGSG